ncbi:hypothetical protein [Pseudonocardia sp. D17]|uniref:hypothetical protein n=1 Tax=Pseudonocardia sp. D17 TaxID=882661 RepID=UPI002B3E4742|nr:hypothetical protein PSD17_55460 [Pseudonocardia sp. D17]
MTAQQRARFRRNTAGVRAYLSRNPQLRAAVERHARDVAGRIAAAPSGVYDRMPTPIVQPAPVAGVRGDRAGAVVTVPAPAPGEVRYPDVKSRFRAVATVVGTVSRR